MATDRQYWLKIFLLRGLYRFAVGFADKTDYDIVGLEI